MSACRFCPVDDRCDIPLDCTDEQTIRRLVDAANEYIRENSARFDRVCELLMKGCESPRPLVRIACAVSDTVICMIAT
jgi:hypothetical protein